MSFWTKGRRDQFRTVLRDAFEVMEIGPDDVDTYVRRHAPKYGLAPVVGKRTIERFLAGKVKTRAASLSAALIGLAEDCLEQDNLPPSDKTRLEPLFEFFALFEPELEQMREAPAALPGYVGASRSMYTRENIAAVTDVMLAYLHLPSDASQSCETAFFNQSDPQRVYFKTYRYTGQEQQVQKSFTIIHRPTEIIPVTRFSNYFDFDGRPRMSSGVALRFGKEIFFFGQTDKGTSAKSLVFNHIAAPQDRYTGLVLTNEPDGGAVSARFVMQKTDVEHHRQTTTGCFDLNDTNIELDDTDKERLRNRTSFNLEQKLVDAQGAIVSQKAMVVRLEEMLALGSLPDGRKLSLFLEDGTPFNPADHVHYTFNSALKIRD